MVPAQDSGHVERFAEFFRDYYSEDIATLARHYPRDQRSLHVEWRDLHQFDAELADDYRRHPDRCQEAAEEALRQFDLPIDVSLDQAHVRMHRLAETHDAGEIHSTHLTHLVSLTGVVDRADAPTSDLQHAVFVCQRCNYETVVPQSSGPDRQDPYQCESCERSGPFKLDPEESEFVDCQQIRLRERPMGGTTAADHESIIAILEDDLVDDVAPGDHVILTGVVRYDDDTPFDATIVDKYLATNAIDDDPTFGIDIDSHQDEITALAHRDTIYEDLIASLAPSVHGYDDIKLALLLQLFSGVTKHLPDNTRIRGDIHTLLIGNPSTGKTRLLKAFTNIAQHAIYVDASNSTGVGLTTAAVRTSSGRNAWELEAGPLTLADNGFLALDSLNHLPDDDQQKLREPLEHQQLSASKGDTTTTLTAQTSVLAAANPQYGHWDNYEPLTDQLDLDPGLISTFDLVFRTHEDTSDAREFADAILQTNHAGELLACHNHSDTDAVDQDILDAVTPPIAPDLLGAYAAYARTNCYPTLTDDAQQALEDFYVTLRSQTDDVDTPPLTTNLETLVRLAEASARIRLSNTITTDDINRITELTTHSLTTPDPEDAAGDFDPDIVETGAQSADTAASEHPLRDTQKTRRLRTVVEELEDQHEEGAPIDNVISLAVERVIYPGITKGEAENRVETLKKQGEAYEPMTGYLRTT